MQAISSAVAWAWPRRTNKTNAAESAAQATPGSAPLAPVDSQDTLSMAAEFDDSASVASSAVSDSYRGAHRLWMTEMRSAIETKAITEIKMLGTHNSATHSISAATCDGTHPGAAAAIRWLASKWYTKRLTLNITAPWAQCQRYGVRRQLEDGVRYLDVRVGIRSDVSPIAHDFATARQQREASTGRSVEEPANGSSERFTFGASSSFATDGDASPAKGPMPLHAETPVVKPAPTEWQPTAGSPAVQDRTATSPAEELWTCHTVWGCPFADVVRDIAAFFESLPHGHSEVVILDIQKSFGFTAKRHIEMLADALLPLAAVTVEAVAPETMLQPLKELLDRDPQRRLIVLHHSEDIAAELPCISGPRKPIVVSEWANTRYVSVLTERLRGLLRPADVSGQGMPTIGQLVVTQGILTPTERDVSSGALLGVSGLVYRSIEDMAATANPAVLDLWAGIAPLRKATTTPMEQPWRRSDLRNVLLLDYYEIGTTSDGLSAIDLVRRLNAVAEPSLPTASP